MSLLILTIGIVFLVLGLAGLVGFAVVFFGSLMGLDKSEEL